MNSAPALLLFNLLINREWFRRAPYVLDGSVTLPWQYEFEFHCRGLQHADRPAEVKYNWFLDLIGFKLWFSKKYSMVFSVSQVALAEVFVHFSFLAVFTESLLLALRIKNTKVRTRNWKSSYHQGLYNGLLKMKRTERNALTLCSVFLNYNILWFDLSGHFAVFLYL